MPVKTKVLIIGLIIVTGSVIGVTQMQRSDSESATPNTQENSQSTSLVHTQQSERQSQSDADLEIASVELPASFEDEHSKASVVPQIQKISQTDINRRHDLNVKSANLNIPQDAKNIDARSENSVSGHAVESKTSEARLVARATANLAPRDLPKFRELRANPVIRTYSGKLRSPYLAVEACNTDQDETVCKTTVTHQTTKAVIFDGEQWAKGYVPTGVGEEAVKLSVTRQ